VFFYSYCLFYYYSYYSVYCSYSSTVTGKKGRPAYDDVIGNLDKFVKDHRILLEQSGILIQIDGQNIKGLKNNPGPIAKVVNTIQHDEYIEELLDELG